MSASKSIEVNVREVYGSPVYYPNCAASQLFAQIAGTKTLTKKVLAHILALGYEVRTRPLENLTF